jgi:hypothetical protein
MGSAATIPALQININAHIVLVARFIPGTPEFSFCRFAIVGLPVLV